MFLTTFLRIFHLIVNFLIGLLLANLLLPENFGGISLLIVNASIVSLVTSLGIESLMMHSLVNKKWTIDFSYSVIWNVVGLQTVLFILMQVIAALFFHVTALSGGNTSLLFFEVIYFIGLILVEKFVVLFYSLHKALLANIILLSCTFIYLLSIVSYSYFFSINYATVFSILSFQSLLQGAALAIIFKLNNLKIKITLIDFKLLFKAIKVSAVVMITNVIQLLAYRIDFIFIKHFFSNQEVGIYAQATKFANLVWIFPNIISLLLIPKFENISNQHLAIVFRWATLSNFLLLVSTIFFSLCCYNYFLTPIYSKGILSLFLMLPGYFCWALVIYFGAYYSWLGKFHYNFWGSLSCFILILICDLWLIPSYSIYGAAIANTVAYSCTLLFYLIVFFRSQAFTIAGVFVWHKTDFHFLQKLIK